MWLYKIKKFFGLLPSMDWLENKRITPDISRLELKTNHLLFVVDDMKKGFKNHCALNNAKLVGHCYTQRSYTFESFQNGSIYVPVARTLSSYSGVGAKPRKILGELYLVDTETLTQLDTNKLNGVLFNRQRVHLIYPFRRKYRYISNGDFHLPPALQGEKLANEQVRILLAFMYVGNKKYWDEFPLSDFEEVANFPYENPYNKRAWLKENFYKLPKPK